MSPIDFDRDPLAWMDRAIVDSTRAHWLDHDELFVVDAITTRDILKNEDGLFAEHSDFFGIGDDVLAPRAEQIAFGRASHKLIQDHLRGLDPAAFVAALPATTPWPRVGNALLLDMMRPILASPARSPRFRAALERLVEARILRRHEKPVGRLRRIVQRFRYFHAFASEVEDGLYRDPPCDILDIVLSQRHRLGDEGLLRLYTGVVFSLASSVGFTLGWALLQTLRHQRTDYRPVQHLIQESLRLWPVAWLFERRACADMQLLGEAVTPETKILFSSYAVQRDPARWDHPGTFLPERWHGRTDRSAWIPFGAGPHACVAASLSMGLVEKLLAAILAREPRLEGGDDGPSIGPALAPPRFTLHLDR